MQNEIDYYVGISNPRGEDPSKNTTFLDENQLEILQYKIQGLPVHVNHCCRFEDGTPVPPSGYVMAGKVDPETGKFYVAWKLNDSPFGRFAKEFLGESDLDNKEVMRQLSFGYSALYRDRENGYRDILGNTVDELSICYVGARPGTDIVARVWKQPCERAPSKIEYFKPKKTEERKLEKKEYTTPELFRNIHKLSKLI